MVLPTLDAHAHFDPSRSSDELAEAGALLAMTLSLDKADKVVHREEPLIAWGVGCHPRKLPAQKAFDPDRFTELAGKSAIIGAMFVTSLVNAANGLGIPAHTAELKTSWEARSFSPSAYGVFGVVYNRRLLSYRPMGGKTLREMLEKSNEQILP